MAKTYMACDGKLLLTLRREDDWYVVRSPMEPELTTQARTLEEAFERAHDAMKGLRRVRMKMFKQTRRPNVRKRRK